MLEKCPHCPLRVRKGGLERHLKQCVKYRRKLKVIIPVEVPVEIHIPEVETKKKRKKKDENTI
jgi:hypothetical protein